MHIVLGILGGLLGLCAGGRSGALLGTVIGILAAEVMAQRRRIAALEKLCRSLSPALPGEGAFTPAAGQDEPLRVAKKPETPPAGPGSIENFRAAAATHPAPAADQADGGRVGFLDDFFAELGDGLGKVSALLSRFFSGGNPVLKIGIVVLFFGVAFLLKYAAQRDLVPLEYRLIGVALAGLALLAAGWRLRQRTLGYGLILQGGGIGILYLVVYAAARLYHFLPFALSLAVMIVLVVLAGFLAVLQEAKALAVAGIVGGFLAPVLMSTGGGNHVLLFSYYVPLNLGILGIAWFKSWRELNLLGFVFTFAIATVWGYNAYRPENFSTSEPFLVFFFVLYIAISVLFAQQQPINLRGYIDGPLVFGLPLVVSALQYSLVRDQRYGMAISALVLGLFYALLATLLWRRLAEGLRMLIEAFLALAVAFGSLAIPLAFDGQWTSAAWALEGAAMVWVGARQQRPWARLFALLLQVGAAVFFLDGVWYPFGAPAFINRYFLGCLIFALSALFSSFYLDRFRSGLRRWEHFISLPLLVWGLLWWYLGGALEIDRQFAVDQFADILLLFCSAGTMLMTMVARRLSWQRLILAQPVFLPAMVALVPLALQAIGPDSHLLAGWGAMAWPVALFTGYRLLYLVEDLWPRRLAALWHQGSLWLLLFLLSHEAAWLVRQGIGPGVTWQAICWGLVPAAAVSWLTRLGARLRWPTGKYIEDYGGIGCLVPGIWLLVWNLFCLTLPGDPAPIIYLPLVNPLELSQLLSLTVLFFWAREAGRQGWRLPTGLSPPVVFRVLAGAVFLILNSTVARTVHFFADVTYTTSALYHSLVFQAALAALWGTSALVITVWSARNGNRRIWCVGAALLTLVVVKLFVIDLSGTGTIARIVSFLVVGILMLIIGYFSPLPPQQGEEK